MKSGSSNMGAAFFNPDQTKLNNVLNVKIS